MFKTIAEFKAFNKETGRNFFDRDSMRFFRSRIESGLLKGKYFITSEQFDDNSPRLYSIRQANDDGYVTTLGTFQRFKTLKDAREEVKNLD